MPRPKHKVEYYLKKIINEEISKLHLDEILEPKNTEYKIIKCRSVADYKCIAYTFKTNKGNSYDVEFYISPIGEEKEIIINTTNDIDFVKKYGLNKVIVGFTTSKAAEIDGDFVGSMEDPYIERTNQKKQYEVLSKVIFLIKEFIRNNPKFKIYSFLKNTFDSNISVYNNIYQNIFKNEFNKYETEDAFYFIKK